MHIILTIKIYNSVLVVWLDVIIVYQRKNIIIYRSTCKTCAPSYYLTSANICATCITITTNCATCADSTGACSACSSGYYLS
jgi:rRNA maturation endonuclease Nob1